MSKPDPSQDLAAIVSRGKSRPVRKWFIIAVCLAALAGGGWYYKSRSKDTDEGPVYVTESLERGDISIRVTATGNLAPINQVTVGSELSGTAAEV